MFLGRIDFGEAQCSVGLFRSVIFCLTFINEVSEIIKRQVFEDLTFLDSGSV
jgi:hypothetical protein